MDQMQSAASREARDISARLQLADRLFREYYTTCFWHLRPDLIVTAKTLPLIVKGLRLHGGRRGMLAATELLDQ